MALSWWVAELVFKALSLVIPCHMETLQKSLQGELESVLRLWGSAALLLVLLSL